MSYELFERVFVKEYKIIGTIVDITKAKNGETLYIVESDVEGPIPGIDCDWRFPTIDCFEAEIEKIEP